MGAAGTKREPKHNLLSPFDRARGRLLVAPRSWVWMCMREQLAAVLRIYRRLAIESDMEAGCVSGEENLGETVLHAAARAFLIELADEDESDAKRTLVSSPRIRMDAMRCALCACARYWRPERCTALSARPLSSGKERRSTRRSIGSGGPHRQIA